MGFDAVQISPAQKSKHGHEWWARYQPEDYGKIEGLGSWEELKELCRRADELKLRVIGDVVFNHMLVVGSCHEWRQAQANPARLKQLQERLVRETSMRLEDFQWPWFEMSGEHWDNENRYEGWGSGEWSELRYCERVVAAQQKHLRLLLDAGDWRQIPGVRGIRFDAVKHLRPAHLEEHLQLLRKEKVFAYGEVLSVDETMHQEYMALSCPSTDFPLTVFMYRALSEAGQEVFGAVAVSVRALWREGVSGAAARVAKATGEESTSR
ncbi:4-alpha-D-glucan glucanohydrolase) [Durusdinium trenchii]|uniref:alpha-amylase n=1 Tax=Durusdinium trenchii TaxID=1381693 RepID=A0ABP0PXX3_9DINO